MGFRRLISGTATKRTGGKRRALSSISYPTG